MRFNILLPILAAALGIGQVAQSAATASVSTEQLQKAIAQSNKRASIVWRGILPWEPTCVWAPSRKRWNQRQLRKRARRAAAAGLGRAAFA